MLKLSKIDITSIFLTIAIIVFVYTFFGSQTLDMRNQTEELESKIISLSKEYEFLTSKKDDNKNYANAIDKGNTVAKIQERYFKVNATEEVKTIASYLDEYFKDDVCDGRIPWYYVDEESDESIEEPHWKFMTTFNYSVANYPVCWLCLDGDKVLAYSISEYDAGLQKFGEVYCGYPY